MNMSSKFRFLSIFTLALAIFTTGAIAQDKPAATTGEKAEKAHKMGKHGHGQRGFGKRGFGRRGGMFRMMHGLNLSDAQKEQIKGIRQANKPSESVIAELKAIREARKAGTELTAEQKARLTEIREQRIASRKLVHQQIMNVLTAEQKSLVELRKQEMKARREQFKLQRELRRKQKMDGAVTAKPAV
jgi:periplasmic protein CpxP/Spy